MKCLMFSNLSIIYNPTLPKIEDRDKSLKAVKSTDKNHRLLFTAYLGYEGVLFDDYPNCLRYPVGYLYRGNIVTSREAIVEISKLFIKDSDDPLLPAFREHLNFYYESLDINPPWMTDRFQKLVEGGATVRILSGPHSESGLSSHQKRQVVYDRNKNLVYGPLV